MGVPRWMFLVTIILVALSWIPLGYIARARTSKHGYTRQSVVPDMDKQPKFKPQAPNAMFADGRADRRPVQGTVARGRVDGDERFSKGKANGQWVTAFPMPVTDQMMRRGQERFNIYCAPCHGLSGNGNGIVAKRADALQEGTWVPPSSLHDPNVRSRPLGHLFNTITNGIRNMPAYGPQIKEADRWAIVAYVKALQRSQHASIEDVPLDLRPMLR